MPTLQDVPPSNLVILIVYDPYNVKGSEKEGK